MAGAPPAPGGGGRGAHSKRPIHFTREPGEGGFLFSLAIEVTQYVFSVGRTDIDDLICNTIGAYVGALFAHWFGSRWHLVWTVLALLAATAFIVLVFVSNVPCSTGLNAFCHLKEVP